MLVRDDMLLVLFNPRAASVGEVKTQERQQVVVEAHCHAHVSDGNFDMVDDRFHRSSPPHALFCPPHAFSCVIVAAAPPVGPARHDMNHAVRKMPTMAKASPTFAIVPIRNPIHAARPARPAARQLASAVSSPSIAPANGPMMSPGSPRNNPARVPSAAPAIARLVVPRRFMPSVIMAMSTKYVATVRIPSNTIVGTPTRTNP